MEALFLSLRATTKPGDVVVVESPTYFGVLQAIENLGLRPLEVSMEATEGMDLQHLDAVIRRHRVGAIVAVRRFSNPLGSCIPANNRHARIHWRGRHEM